MTVTTYYFAREDTACAFCGREIKKQQMHLKKVRIDARGVKRRVPWCGGCVARARE